MGTSDNVFTRMFSGGNNAPRKESTFNSLTTSSDVFIRVALELLQNAPSAKRNELLKTAIKNSFAALDALPKDSKTMMAIFKPFQMACQSRNSELISIAIDCLGKLFTYNFWGEYDLEGLSEAIDSSNRGHQKDNTGSSIGSIEDDSDLAVEDSEPIATSGTAGMIAFVIDTISNSYSNTDERVELQIVKALQAAVSTSDPAYCLHGRVLIKAIRTTYNIFLVSNSTSVQTVAQGALTQMVQYVYGRVPKGIQMTLQRETEVTVEKPVKKSEPKAQSVSSLNSSLQPSDGIAKEETQFVVEDEGETPKMKSNTPDILPETTQEKAVVTPKPDVNVDRQLKDAYQVLVTLSKLSMRSVPMPEGTMDLRSQPMRSKLLALHLLLTILSSNAYVFLTPCKKLFKETSGKENAIFIDATKEYLCLSVSRNAISVVPPVLEVAVDVFGKMVIHLREVLKKEISVMFTEIIIPMIEAKKQFSFYQRITLMKGLHRILSDPKTDGGRILVEIYLNYDCDVEAGARENIWERLVSALAKALSQHYEPNSSTSAPVMINSFGHSSGGITPAMTTANLTNFTRDQVKELYSLTGDSHEIRKNGLDLVVKGFLKPLVAWCSARVKPEAKKNQAQDGRHEDADKATSLLSGETKITADDPQAFENMKHKKKAMLEGVKRFNQKPKKGLQYLLETACIPSRTPEDIAKFLLKTEGLSKSMIGEFLGDGDEENIAIMHSFVDQMDFKGLKFIDALRFFLQSFRLPGEAQKIDRFMLKFADRFLKGSPASFSSADTAYVLAYSVIMLNTDQHNTQVKKKMTKQDFIKNNRGIDEGKDLPLELLESIFDEIQTNEIVMKDEQENAKNKNGSAEASESKNVVQQFVTTSENMALKSETMFKNKSQNAEYNFINANHYQHVKPMFLLVWMSFLTTVSSPLQSSDDVETNMTALEGFKYCMYIASLFEMDIERKTFILTLCKFTMLSSLESMRAKNFESIKTLLEIAYSEGNALREDWKDVVTCISQFDKLQSAGQNASSMAAIEQELLKQRTGMDSKHQREFSDRRGGKPSFLSEAASAANSQGMTVLLDRIFTGSINLSGPAIVAFVKALCEVSWEEITTSSSGTTPRMYCLQRLIEISYYNMKRVRIEWSNLWAILGEHFNQVGSFPNANVGFFAIDKLRQLAMKFLELEELSNFKFQKDFLRPFEEILVNNPDPKIKDMVLACIQQMVQAKSKSFKSGWKAIFSTLSKAAKEGQGDYYFKVLITSEPIVVLGFDIMKAISKNSFEAVIANGMFPEFVVCLVEFCKNCKFAKTSLQSIELLKITVTKIGDLDRAQIASGEPSMPVTQKSVDNLYNMIQGASGTPTSTITQSVHSKFDKSMIPEADPSVRYWLPILYALHEIIMTCDLEVRTRGLNYLFETLKNYGPHFSPDFWALVSKSIIFSIFADLKDGEREQNNLVSKEEASAWTSTTLIQALRQLVDLFGQLFAVMSFMLDGILDLLKTCLVQDNETLSRIGATCLQQLIETNLSKFDTEMWDSICNMFTALVDTTTPHALFFDLSDGANGPDPKTALGRTLCSRPQKKDFQQIISKCVQHLLVLQTLTDIINSGTDMNVYRSLKVQHLKRVLACFESSYQFAKEFNADMDLRNALFKMGFMKQMPNLLKQETSAVSVYLAVLNRIYCDQNSDRIELKSEIEARMIPLSLEILGNYNSLDPESKRRNVTSWRPVIVNILSGLADFDNDDLKKHMGSFYSQLVGLLSQEMTPELRLPLLTIFMRIGILWGITSQQSLSTKMDNALFSKNDTKGLVGGTEEDDGFSSMQ